MQGGYSGYNEYRPGYGAQNYTGSGMGGGGAYRGGRGAGDGGQMNNQNNPLWAAQGYPVTGPGGSVIVPGAVWPAVCSFLQNGRTLVLAVLL